MATKTHADHQLRHLGDGEMTDGSAAKILLDVPKVSKEERDGLIQVRAYELWEQAGKPDGNCDSERFWCEAEKEIMASHASADREESQ